MASQDTSAQGLAGLSLADLHSLHDRLIKEQGYATEGQKPAYAEAIANVTNEQNNRLRNIFGEGKFNANVSGGIVPGEYSNTSATVANAELAKQGDNQEPAPGVEPKKQTGTTA